MTGVAISSLPLFTGDPLSSDYIVIVNPNNGVLTTQKMRWEDVVASIAQSVSVGTTDDENTRFAEQSLAGLNTADENGLTVSSRPAGIGCAAAGIFTSGSYSMGLSPIPFSPTFVFEREGDGVAVNGGETETFAANTPRILGRWFKDAGGVQLLNSPTNFSEVSWVKTNLGTPTAAAGPGGPSSAWQMLETTATGTHSFTQSITGLDPETQFTVHALVKVTGRDYLQFDLYNNSTSSGVRTRYSLLNGGSIISPYPAELGSQGVSGLNAGILDYGDGYWFLWQTVTLSGTTTGIRPYLYLMSNSTTTSYTGDAAKGMTVEAVWAVANTSVPVNYLTGVREPETPIEVPLGLGNYIARIVDAGGETTAALPITTLGQRWSVEPRAIYPWVDEFQAYTLQCYDTVDRANTSAGDLGTATDGGTYDLLKNPGSFPMVPATNGFVLDDAYQFTPASGADGAVYAVRSIGGPVVRFISAEVAWTSDTGTSSNTAAALLTSNDLPNLTAHMPVHCTLGRTVGKLQFRTVADGFVTLGSIKPVLGSLPKDGTWYQVSVAIQGNLAQFTWAEYSVVVQDDIFLEDAEFACWELFSDMAFGSNTDKVQMRNLLASYAEVGSALSYTATAPVNIVLPFAAGTPVAGNTYTASSTQGGWTSNDGDIAYTYQWQLNGVDVGGATSASFATATPADVGKRVSVRVTATNGTGATSATSPQSAPLA